MMTPEDLCIPIAKIRMVADIFDIEHYRVKNDRDDVHIHGQVFIGAHHALWEIAHEIEETTRKEFDKWWDERELYKRTIDKLNRRITELRGGISHEDNR